MNGQSYEATMCDDQRDAGMCEFEAIRPMAETTKGGETKTCVAIAQKAVAAKGVEIKNVLKLRRD